ncbi:monoamine oxidase [Mucilaginibacter lappiensis]|uniref:Tryptophan 2-monooxygenase n=1 Tax=Mucilaginibacter lappiensis TaxID=354630 RepID=A0ABR6PLA1_9SPHI|nr:NAD(P)/FAD-dependent oxidoreductase [Mucilaginibacter lappiensis]MBB6110552.1 monoamine oxidase [Mucilaginibacter lappiensis]SIR41137.1 monoamine oxidase [Mucilaginibacter lappiensis]
MNTADILIIGAGAAGLMAARELANAGKKVIVLEADNRIGGRIYTQYDASTRKYTELGAEFVHGDLPVTLGLLNEAGIKYRSASAEMVQYDQGAFLEDESFIEHWDLLIDQLNSLQQDISIDEFMSKEFSGDKYDRMRTSVRQFVSGYDTGDPKKASCFALRKEWQSDDDSAQHRVEGGYVSLLNYLAGACKVNGGEILLNAIVKDIYWEPGKVSAIIADGTAYHAQQMILAVPLGVLKASEGQAGAITFHPQLKAHREAIKHMGFGAVIKILLEFDEPFWYSEETEIRIGRSLDHMGYLLSQEEIPTWWTQFPERSSVFTGWIGGPEARAKKEMSDEDILMESLQSVANIFRLGVDELRQRLKTWQVINWTAKPFTRGSYAYDTVNAAACRHTLNTPVDDTLFFTGEYLYEGTAMGTVEAALTSGKGVAVAIRSININ